MNNPRANIAQIALAAGGALLALSTFLSWLEETSLWKATSVFDILIFFLALATAALAVMHITGQNAGPPALRHELTSWLGLIPATLALGLVLEFWLSDAEAKFGTVIAFLASLAILAGLVLRERPDLAAKLNEATAGIGSGGGPGGPGGPGGQPGYAGGQPAAGAPAPSPSAQPQQPASPSPSQPEPQQPAAPQTAPQPVQTPSPSAQPGQQESSGPAPGWYPDPQGQKRLRYWDGSRWTEQTAD